MDKTNFLTIYRTFERLDVVKKNLPGIIEEVRRNDARLIVHDSSVHDREDKWNYLKEQNHNDDFFLLLSSNMSSAHVVNMCLQLGQELYAPEFICIIEDDHGFLPGIITSLIEAMKKYYGLVSPNGLRYGVFTGCAIHNTHINKQLPDGHFYPSGDNVVNQIGRANACFRCAPTSHWNNILKGFDTDEYLISNYQVSNLNLRNYNKGFTSLLVNGGQMCTFNDTPGRGVSEKSSLKMWDENYTASDARSRFSK